METLLSEVFKPGVTNMVPPGGPIRLPEMAVGYVLKMKLVNKRVRHCTVIVFFELVTLSMIFNRVQ